MYVKVLLGISCVVVIVRVGGVTGIRVLEGKGSICKGLFRVMHGLPKGSVA